MVEGKGQKKNHFEWPGFVLTGPEIETCVERAVEGKNAELSQRQSTESAMWFRTNANATMAYSSTSWAWRNLRTPPLEVLHCLALRDKGLSRIA